MRTRKKAGRDHWKNPNKLIRGRKSDHIRICLEEDVAHSYNFWDDIQLQHNALPELDLSSIDTGIELFGKSLRAPIVISAITGGCPEGKKINRNLAEAAEVLRIGMGVGSQRPALEDTSLKDTFAVVKEYDIPLVIANVGAPQLINQKGAKTRVTPALARQAMDMVGADILAVHMNYLQEIVQPEGDVNAAGCISAIRSLAKELPVLAKETGAGFSRETALRLKEAGVKGFDAGGAGGTSFAAVEKYRAEKEIHRRLGHLLHDWGTPTPISVINCSVGLPVIATGGIRSGLDVARAISMGASSAGLARRVLPAASKNSDAVIVELKQIIEELKGVMFLCGASDLKELASVKRIVTGRTREWMGG